MDTAGALFNSRFDNKELRNELLNKKEERENKVIGKVKRYRPGVVPDFAKKKDELEASQKEKDKRIVIDKKRDSRLERLHAAQNMIKRNVQEEEVGLKEEELLMRGESVVASPKSELLTIDMDKEETMTEEQEAQRRRLLLSRALDDEKEELETMDESEEQPIQEESEADDEYKSSDSEDEGTLFALRHRPTFISKANRKTIEDPEEKLRKERELEELEELKYKQRVRETQKMIEEVKVKEIEEEENRGKKKDPRTEEEIPDDTDDLNNPDEKEAWRWREFYRILRERQREEQRKQDEEEKKRRGRMTDEELAAENKRLEEEGVRKKKQEHVQGTFLQKYYHKGVFYLDDESITSPDDIRNRDFHAPTERDKVNKLAMPKVMQVRDFGKRSQSKWTYLRNEDTTKTKDWLNELQTKNAETKFKHAGNKCECLLHQSSFKQMDLEVLESLRKGNIVVFLDVSIGGSPSGRIKLELFKNKCPKTVENFRQFCTGEYSVSRLPMGYKKTRIHRIIKGFMIQGGDFMKGDGTGSLSIYGDHFEDENFDIRFDRAGLLAMANAGPNTNGCQFFITCAPAPHLNGKHVAFGRVLDSDSLLIVHKIEHLPCEKDKPILDVIVTQCGQL
ncbi:hypothetical protein WA171_003781 [Blastocystis sp. BT1]